MRSQHGVKTCLRLLSLDLLPFALISCCDLMTQSGHVLISCFDLVLRPLPPKQKDLLLQGWGDLSTRSKHEVNAFGRRS